MKDGHNKELPRPRLLIAKTKADEILRSLIEKGNEIEKMKIWEETQLEKAHIEYEKWEKYCAHSLEKMFENAFYAKEFLDAYSVGAIPHDFSTQVDSLMRYVESKKAALDSIREGLELVDEVTITPTTTAAPNSNSKEVFIAHGHDRAVLQQVARFVTDLGLIPVVLQEQADGGMTLIEKLEHYAKDSRYAIVLLTPDDTGYSIAEGPTHAMPRARQNVIAELGYFVGKLGRKNVCVVHKEDLEIPSDFNGVLYVPFDEGEGWKIKLAKEIKHSGIPVDTSRILG